MQVQQSILNRKLKKNDNYTFKKILAQSPLRLVLLLILFMFACFVFSPTAKAVSRRRMEVTPAATRRKGKTPCLVSPAVASIRRLVSFRLGAMPLASSIRPPARGRFSPTPRTKIRLLALWRF